MPFKLGACVGSTILAPDASTVSADTRAKVGGGPTVEQLPQCQLTLPLQVGPLLGKFGGFFFGFCGLLSGGEVRTQIPNRSLTSGWVALVETRPLDGDLACTCDRVTP